MKNGENMDISTMFTVSKAKGAYSLRNMIINASYLASSGRNFIKEGSVKLTNNEISILKSCVEVCKSVLSFVE